MGAPQSVIFSQFFYRYPAERFRVTALHTQEILTLISEAEIKTLATKWDFLQGSLEAGLTFKARILSHHEISNDTDNFRNLEELMIEHMQQVHYQLQPHFKIDEWWPQSVFDTALQRFQLACNNKVNLTRTITNLKQAYYTHAQKKIPAIFCQSSSFLRNPFPKIVSILIKALIPFATLQSCRLGF